MNLERYQRHIQLTEVGEQGQKRLSNAKILVVGAGGLGCPVLQYLAAAGIGRLGIVDPDTVSLNNLQRQVLYSENDIGKIQSQLREKKVKRTKPRSNRRYICGKFCSKDNYRQILNDYDIVIDGTDNFETRYLLSDACLLMDKVLVFGALYKFEGQVSVFNYQDDQHIVACFRSHQAWERFQTVQKLAFWVFYLG